MAHQQLFKTLAVGVSLIAGGAQASGFYLGDNGSKALIQGGAFTAQADDLTAIQHNPGGLSQLDGFHFLVDAQLLTHNVTVQREDNPLMPSGISNPVSNNGGMFFLPFIGLAYGAPIDNRAFTIALGLYGPPSVGRYNFGEPDYTRTDPNRPNSPYVNDPRKNNSLRYGLIKNDIIILYPTLTASMASLDKRISLGLSLQYVFSTFHFEQALYSGLTTPQRQTQEDPSFDSIVKVSLTGKPQFTTILGLRVEPIDDLSFGASVRPPIPIVASGTLDIQLGEKATQLNSKVTGNQADLALTLPLELRAGARYKAFHRLGINFDFVYQGWESVQELLLTPKDVSLQIGGGNPTKVEEFHIPKRWRSTWSTRLGLSFDVLEQLTLHAGAMYESSASEDRFATIDFLHFDRFMVSGGASVRMAGFELVLGAAWFPTINKTITNSEVQAGSTDASVPGAVIGNGLYSSGGFILTAGIRGGFFKHDKKATVDSK